jgi:nitroimidazol reductase NimA-like FMN-containing flavoprotein (pyridoxamine 5'-phosphate oxidase superfamily)
MSSALQHGRTTMTTAEPTSELDAPYSSPDASPTSWARARSVFAEAAIYWLATVRADGRPHVTPVIAVWHDGAIHVCTGPEEQKAKNLGANHGVTVTTGTNVWAGLDVVVEGQAQRVADDATLRELAAAWEAKYGAEWHFGVADGAFRHDADEALVFAVAPSKAYAYDRDEPGGATRFRF